LSSYPTEQKPVKITVKTTIRNGHEKETYELTTFGRYTKKTNAVYLQYEEMMEEGTVNTVVKVSEKEGSIMRSGAIKMRLAFKKNTSLAGIYETPYGVFEMNTLTTRLDHGYNELIGKGEIDLLYDLKVQRAKQGTYHLLITFEEEKK
jgi:uncharacterized beta-barrel protein YwiB (DUF1934 family)